MRKLIYREYVVYTFDELKEEVQKNVTNKRYYKLLRDNPHARTQEAKDNLKDIVKRGNPAYWYFSDGRVAEVKI